MAHVFRPIPEDMLGAHQPREGAHESWQESWGFVWHDPHRGRWRLPISIQRLRGIADVHNWVAYGGEVVGRYQRASTCRCPRRTSRIGRPVG
jgi:hypothetical protein